MTNKLDHDDLKLVQVGENDIRDENFKSDVEEFTTYYHWDSLHDIRERLVHMYVIKHDGCTIGYVTLAMSHIRYDATQQIRKKGINGTVPALIISHLAVHEDFQRQGIGNRLLNVIFNLMPRLERYAGCRYVIVHPRNDAGVRKFYKEYGFTYYPDFKDDKCRDAFLMDLKNFS